MNIKKARKLHDLLYTFMGLFHEKFIIKFRHEYKHPSWLKKNHAKIINLLYQNKHLTSTEIGRMLDIEKGSLTTLIDQLEERNFTIRSVDPKDRRRYLISLSSKGKAEMERVMNLYAQKLNKLLNDKNPAEIEEFLRSLQLVVKFMKNV